QVPEDQSRTSTNPASSTCGASPATTSQGLARATIEARHGQARPGGVCVLQSRWLATLSQQFQRQLAAGSGEGRIGEGDLPQPAAQSRICTNPRRSRRGESEPPAWALEANNYAFHLCPRIRGSGFGCRRCYRKGAGIVPGANSVPIRRLYPSKGPIFR